MDGSGTEVKSMFGLLEDHAVTSSCIIKSAVDVGSIFVRVMLECSEHLFSEIWAVVDGPRFFQTLIWLLAFNKDLRYSSCTYFFLA